MSYSWPRTTLDGLHLDSSRWRAFLRSKIEPEIVVYCFSDVDPENKSQIIGFLLQSLILWRSKSVPIFPSIRASLHFEERSGDTSNFPKTLHNFSTSSARWHQNIMPRNILTCWFYLQKFHSLLKPSAIFDHKRHSFDLLTIKTTIRCTPCLSLLEKKWIKLVRGGTATREIIPLILPRITWNFHIQFATCRWPFYQRHVTVTCKPGTI